jgi:hypothetical protein
MSPIIPANVIENCFDRLKLSFEVGLGTGLRTTYTMHIWDATIRDIAVEGSEGLTIGDFEGRELQVNEGHHLYRKCFAYQSLWACSKYLGGAFKEDSIYYRMDSLNETGREQFFRIVKTKAAAAVQQAAQQDI